MELQKNDEIDSFKENQQKLQKEFEDNLDEKTKNIEKKAGL